MVNFAKMAHMNHFYPETIPLSLYIHIPWCVRKCPYCDFNSHTLGDELPEQAYIDALLKDFSQALDLIQGRELQSIFIGGGTPSLFSAQALERLFEQLQQQITFAENIEITLEANPGTVEQARFADYRSLGINRLSLGVQSFSDEQLKKLGRIHDAKQAQYAIETVHRAGFKRWNLDIMYGLPQQSIDDALTDLKTALSFSPSHLSWYQLTLEPNTVFYKYPPVLPQDDCLFEMMQQGKALLAEQGLAQYEISAYAKPEQQCQHNKNYWLFGDYVGIGAGAHGKITLKNKIIRTTKLRQPNKYLTTENKLTKQQVLSAADLQFEFMLNVLRLNQKVLWDIFSARTGCDWQQLKPKLVEAQQKGLLSWNSEGCQVTEHGQRFLNDLQSLFLADEV